MWTTKELQILSSEYTKASKQELLILFPTNKYSTIVNKANKLKLYREIEGQKLIKLLDGSLISCYWLGFILADGSLTKNQLRITLAEKDLEHLQKLASYLDYPESKLSMRKQTHGYGIGNISYTLCLGDASSVKQVQKYLTLSHTNKTKIPPQLDMSQFTDDQITALFVGYFDGDGCKSKNRLQFSISLEWEIFILDILKRMNNILACNDTPYIKKTKYLFVRLNANFTKSLMSHIQTFNLPFLLRKYK